MATANSLHPENALPSNLPATKSERFPHIDFNFTQFSNALICILAPSGTSILSISLQLSNAYAGTSRSVNFMFDLNFLHPQKTPFSNFPATKALRSPHIFISFPHSSNALVCIFAPSGISTHSISLQ